MSEFYITTINAPMIEGKVMPVATDFHADHKTAKRFSRNSPMQCEIVQANATDYAVVMLFNMGDEIVLPKGFQRRESALAAVQPLKALFPNAHIEARPFSETALYKRTFKGGKND